MVFLNGQFIPDEEAKISVLDRGFIFGDGVYEVIPVYSRRPFRLVAHLKRLQHSLDGIKLPNPYTEAEWVSTIERLISFNQLTDQSVYLQITRGAAKRDQPFPAPPVPQTVFMMCNPLSTPPADWLLKGIACITAPDNRWLRCDIKSISLLPNVLLAQRAVEAGCIETILIRDDEFMTEGSSSNIFLVKNGILIAPPKDNLMLPGITYDVVMEIAAANDIPHEIRRVAKDELFTADELLLTSSPKEVLAITQLDGKIVGDGMPGTMFTRLHRLYQDFKRDKMRGE
jgi:D-alanine transaminase